MSHLSTFKALFVWIFISCLQSLSISNKCHLILSSREMLSFIVVIILVIDQKIICLCRVCRIVIISFQKCVFNLSINLPNLSRSALTSMPFTVVLSRIFSLAHLYWSCVYPVAGLAGSSSFRCMSSHSIPPKLFMTSTVFWTLSKYSWQLISGVCLKL